MPDQMTRRKRTQLGFIASIICLAISCVLWTLKYTIAPSIPFWVTLIPLVPIVALVGSTVVIFCLVLFCGLVIAFIVGVSKVFRKISSSISWLLNRF